MKRRFEVVCLSGAMKWHTRHLIYGESGRRLLARGARGLTYEAASEELRRLLDDGWHRENLQVRRMKSTTEPECGCSTCREYPDG